MDTKNNPYEDGEESETEQNKLVRHGNEIKVMPTSYNVNHAVPDNPSSSDPSYDPSSQKVIKRWTHTCTSKVRRSCTPKLLLKRLPILQWLPHYTVQKLVADVVSGIAVGLTLIPQAIAYADVAGLPLQYGLYAGFMAPFIYTFLGTAKELSLGPTAVISLMTKEYTTMGGIPYAVVLGFLSGCVELAAGLLNLGFLIDFISGTVISGFVSAAAITVGTTQVKSLFGLKFKGSEFVTVWKGFFENFMTIQPYDTALGLSCCVLLLLLRKLSVVKSWCKNSSCMKSRIVDRTLWFISTSRNAVVVILGCVLAYVLEQNGLKPFALTGNITPGIPNFAVPPFNFYQTVKPGKSHLAAANHSLVNATAAVGHTLLNATALNQTLVNATALNHTLVNATALNHTLVNATAFNHTYVDTTMPTTTPSGEVYIDFAKICSDLGSGIALVPVICILEQVAIAKAFSAGKKLDATQEMIALGVGTIAGSFFGGMPITASFGRSSVQAASNVETPLANLLTGGIALLALGLIMPSLAYIPKPVLAAVIITSVMFMIEYHEIKPMWKSRRTELIPFFVTFFCCLFINVEYGILIGTGVHLLLLIYQATRPKVVVTGPNAGEAGEAKLWIKADRSLYYPGVEHFRSSLTKAADKVPLETQVVLDFSAMKETDFTSIKALKSIVGDFKKRKQTLYFAGLSPSLRKAFEAVIPAKDLQILPTSSATICTNEGDDGQV